MQATDSGVDPRSLPLIAFGGAGPVHAYGVARKLGIRKVICPLGAGVTSAIGLLGAPVAADLSASLPMRTLVWDALAARRVMESLASQGREVVLASKVLAEERGPCPDAAERGVMERFSHKLAIAPTASISIICGGTSAGIEPIPANIYTHKTLSGSFAVRNPYLEALLEAKGQSTPAVWDTILENEGSVQHLDFLSQDEKDVYKTAFEIDQRWVIDLAADRTPQICQSQSVNVFLAGDVDKWDLHMLHWRAWEQGVKSLYYLRSKSVQRAAHAGADMAVDSAARASEARTDYEECLACQ